MVSMQQGPQALTALFIHEPISLTHVEIPASRIQPLSIATQERLLSTELMQTLTATDSLLTMVSNATKSKPDHHWLSSGHVQKAFAVREKLQALLRLPSFLSDQHDLDCDRHGRNALLALVGQEDRPEGYVSQTGEDAVTPDALGRDGEEASALEDDSATGNYLRTQMDEVLNLKTQILVITQAMFQDAPQPCGGGVGEGVGGRGTMSTDFSADSANVLTNSSVWNLKSSSSTTAALCANSEAETLGEIVTVLSSVEDNDASRGSGLEEGSLRMPEGEEEIKSMLPSQECADQNQKMDGGAKPEEADSKRNSKILDGLGGVVGGLLQGPEGDRASKETKEAVQGGLSSAFESTILSSVVGHCCYVIPGEHLSNNCPLVVHEDEPSSVIALALGSKGYKQALDHAKDFADPTFKLSSSTSRPSGQGEESSQDRASQESHVNVTFEAEGPCGPAELSCKVYFARSFHSLRSRYCATTPAKGDRVSCDVRDAGRSESTGAFRSASGEDDFISSLRRCKQWNPTGGRSGTAWLKTADDRFVLKQISRKEMAHFLQAAHQYFTFITTTMDSDPPIPSCLAKILGLFKVTITLKRGNTKSGSLKAGSGPQVLLSQIFLLTENLLYSREERVQPLTKIFDLKGSSRNRFVKEAKPGEVQLDDNFQAYIQKFPLYLTEEAKRLLTVAVHNDTVFLTKINVMDYSLLVAVDEDSNKIIVGIIDYIRQYTYDKQAETYYKKVRDRMAMGLAGMGCVLRACTRDPNRFALHLPDDWPLPSLHTLLCDWLPMTS